MTAMHSFNKWAVVLSIGVPILTVSGCTQHALRPATAVSHAPAQPSSNIEIALANAENHFLATQRYRLKNGLQVILHHDNRLPQVAVNVWYRVGASDELAHQSGLAHLFEHLMFEGSKHVPQEGHFRFLEEAGATQVNGSTGFSRTNYYEVVPSQQLELALWLESDRMGFLLDVLSQDKLDEQRRVVKNERLQRVDNRPYGLADENAWQALFSDDNPYYGQIIGSIEALNAATLSDAFTFFQTFYTPANATLTIAGDFNPKTIRKQVQHYFGSLKGAKAPSRPTIEPPKLSNEIRLYELENLGKLTKVIMHYITPKLFAPADAECDVLAHLLTGTRFGRLTRALMHDRQLVNSVTSYQSSYQHLSVFTIQALILPQTDPQQETQAVIDIIDEKIADLIQHTATPQEIQRAINYFYTNRLFSLQRLNHRADQLQSYNYYLGTPQGLQADLSRYTKTTPQAITNVVQQYLKPNQRVVLIAQVPAAPKPKQKQPPKTTL